MEHAAVDYIRAYQHEIEFALTEGMSLSLRALRDTLAGITLSIDAGGQLKTLDKTVLVSILELDDIDGDLLRDDELRPLISWWQHLGKIRAHTYPIEKLPDYLQPIYRAALTAA